MQRFRPDVAQNLRDFLRRCRRAFRQFAHFVGNDGEAAAVLSRPGRLNGRIECEQVRLIGNFADELDNFPNAGGLLVQRFNVAGHFLRGIVNAPHAFERLNDGFAAQTCCSAATPPKPH